MEDMTGKQLGRYKIEGPLGEGGMAAVYKAYQANMDRHVALKILPRHFASDPEFTARFDQEARIIAKLQHVHILPVHDYGEAEGYTYIVMPFISTGTLADYLKKGPIPLERIRTVAIQVGGALGYAHARGVIHRDVKPSNILIDDQWDCRLTDFGIAKILAGTIQLTQTGAMAGTPSYMSPEQIQGETLDGRSDLYSLGVVVFEMATGQTPYHGETPGAVLIKHLQQPVPSPRLINPPLPRELEKVIIQSLAKKREERFATAGEFIRAVKKALPESVTSPPHAETKPDKLMARENGGTLPIADHLETLRADAGVAHLGDARTTRKFPIVQPRRVLLTIGAGLLGLTLIGLLATTLFTGDVFRLRPTGGTDGAAITTQLATNTAAPTESATLEPTVSPTVPAAATSDFQAPAEIGTFIDLGASNRMFPFDPQDIDFHPGGVHAAVGLANRGDQETPGALQIFSLGGVFQLNAGRVIVGVSWSPDGSLLATATDGTVGIWDIDIARQEFTVDWIYPTRVFSDNFNAIDWSPDGSRIVLAAGRTMVVLDPEGGDRGDAQYN